MDHYQVLKLRRDADTDEIHRAYRAFARLCHPDLNTGSDSAARMARVNEAYKCLSDPEQRRQYDIRLNVREPLELQTAILEAAAARLTQPGWSSVRTEAGDSIFEGHGQRVLVRFIATLGSSEIASWIGAARRAFFQEAADSTVAVAHRVLVPDTVPERPLGGRIPTTSIDLVEGRRIGCEFRDPSVEALFTPFLVDLR